jgi:hypothetical protein
MTQVLAAVHRNTVLMAADSRVTVVEVNSGQTLSVGKDEKLFLIGNYGAATFGSGPVNRSVPDEIGQIANVPKTVAGLQTP